MICQYGIVKSGTEGGCVAEMLAVAKVSTSPVVYGIGPFVGSSVNQNQRRLACLCDAVEVS